MLTLGQPTKAGTLVSKLFLSYFVSTFICNRTITLSTTPSQFRGEIFQTTGMNLRSNLWGNMIARKSDRTTTNFTRNILKICPFFSRVNYILFSRMAQCNKTAANATAGPIYTCNEDLITLKAEFIYDCDEVCMISIHSHTLLWIQTLKRHYCNSVLVRNPPTSLDIF